ncbi:MAG: hypothetical protein ACREH8_13980 [Opitutaceae bacterium]
MGQTPVRATARRARLRAPTSPQGYHRMPGARPMRRAVERCMQDAIVSHLLAGRRGIGMPYRR